MATTILTSEYSKPANARHGHYVQVRFDGTMAEARQAADEAAALAGYDPQGPTDQGMPVSEDRGTRRLSVWYFRTALTIACPRGHGSFYSADYKLHAAAAH